MLDGRTGPGLCRLKKTALGARGAGAAPVPLLLGLGAVHELELDVKNLGGNKA